MNIREISKLKLAQGLLGNMLKNQSSTLILEGYIANIQYLKKTKDEELLKLDKCLQYLIDKQFNVTNWQLYSIPTNYLYCFFNEEKKQAFDLAVFIYGERNMEFLHDYILQNGEVIPRYLDSRANENDASTIEEAIQKYDMTGYLGTL